jgi:hypothetical protein
MFDGTPMRMLPESLVEVAYKIFAHDPLHALDRLTGSMTDHDLRLLATIAMRDGTEAAEDFYRSRPRGVQRIGRVSLR